MPKADEPTADQPITRTVLLNARPDQVKDTSRVEVAGGALPGGALPASALPGGALPASALPASARLEVLL